MGAKASTRQLSGTPGSPAAVRRMEVADPTGRVSCFAGNLSRPAASSRVNSIRHSGSFNKPFARVQPTNSLIVLASSLRLRPRQVATTSRIRAISDAGNIRPLHSNALLSAGLPTAAPPLQLYLASHERNVQPSSHPSQVMLGLTK